MNISKLNKAQCEAIIANDYLGKATKKGKQKDYGNYSFEIDMRLCDLNDKIVAKYVKTRLTIAPIISPSLISAPVTISLAHQLPTFLRLGFNNRFALIAHNIINKGLNQ
ncbi:MAG: hypothetical protein RIQ94_163 [Pseudomonadota bacterium]|jgi:hypothetical protein